MSRGRSFQGVDYVVGETESQNVQNVYNGPKNPNNIRKHHDEITRNIKEFVKWTYDDTQHLNTAHPKTNHIDCDGVQLTNAHCHMVHISLLWYKAYSITQLKYAFESKQEIIKISHHPTHRHGQTNSWYVYVS